MEKITLNTPIQLVSKQVKTFPLGIGETFDSLANTLPNGMTRDYYGFSWMEGEKVIYYAAAKQNSAREIHDYALEPRTIEAGEYLTTTVIDWRTKTDSIKDVFHQLMQDARVDKNKPCIEWYQTDDKMLCMIKMIENEYRLMVEVFKTNVCDPDRAALLLKHIHKQFEHYKANFDLHDCDRILRVQSSAEVDAVAIIEILYAFGFEAAVLADEILINALHPSDIKF